MSNIKQDLSKEAVKSTSIGLFPEDWEKNKLSSISCISTGLTPLRSKSEYFADDIFWVKTTDLNNSLIFDTEEKISYLALKETSIKMVEPNSILIAMYGGFNQIGRTGLMKIKGTTNQAISSFYIDEIEYHSEYVLYWLNNFRKYWRRFAASSRKDPNITKKDVEDFPIMKPKYDEQKKIASILSTWDKAIELKEKLIEQKKEQKKGLMQKLLTGEVRLPGFEEEWRKIKLKKLIHEIIDRSTINNQYELLSVTKNGIVPQSEHFNKQIASQDNVGYKIVRKNNLVFSTMNLWMGSLDVLTNKEIGIVSPAYKVFEFTNQLNALYGKYFMTSDYMIWIYNVNSEQGASIVRRNLDLKGLLNTLVKTPSIKEQKAIAKVLFTLEQEVNLLIEELEEIQNQKKGLMQNLLTGKIRVRV